MGQVTSKLRFLNGNAASDTTSLEGRIAAGLAPYRGASTQSSLDHLASGIAFVIRYKLGPRTTAEQVSIIAQSKPDQKIMIFIYQGPEKMKLVLQTTVEDNGDIIAEMSKTVDMAVFKVLCSCHPHFSKSLVEELDAEGDFNPECKSS